MNALRSMNIVVIRIRRHVGRSEMAVRWRGKRNGRWQVLYSGGDIVLIIEMGSTCRQNDDISVVDLWPGCASAQR